MAGRVKMVKLSGKKWDCYAQLDRLPGKKGRHVSKKGPKALRAYCHKHKRKAKR